MSAKGQKRTNAPDGMRLLIQPSRAAGLDRWGINFICFNLISSLRLAV